MGNPRLRLRPRKHGDQMACVRLRMEESLMGSPEEDLITIRMPRSHWAQIVGDIENMCGTSSDEIEILADVVEVQSP